MKNNMITALDIGSSFVRVLIAKTAKDNSLEVLGSSEVPSSGIEKGIVKDIEAVSECVKKALQEAEKASGLKAVNIFTNITGEHIRSNVGDGRISIPSESPKEPGEISQDHVDQVINDAKNGIKILKGYERATILHGIPLQLLSYHAALVKALDSQQLAGAGLDAGAGIAYTLSAGAVLGSSMVEHSAVNRRVAGSSPARGAR